MKYRWATVVVTLLLLSGFGVHNASKGVPLDIEDHGTYCMIRIPDAEYLYNDGYPMLPYYTRTYTFPAGTSINDITVTPQEVEHITLSRKIAPAPPAVPLNMQPVSVEVKEGPVYHQNEFYPQEWYTLRTGMGISNGERVVFVTVHLYPVRYNAVRNEALYAHDFAVRVDHDPPARPLFTNDAYDLLIITPEKWTGNLEPLRQHKDSRGLRSLVMTTEDIYRSYSGRDEPEKIKYAIKDAIETQGIEYVLLVGDVDNVPARYTYAYDGSEDSFPSDLYYADVYFDDGSFCSWDSNNNDRFGEYKYQGETDDVDLYPDVAIGRIACSSDTEVTTVVNKIINYEVTTYGANWFNTIVACGGDTFTPAYDDDSGVYEGEYLNQLVLDTMTGFNGVKLWGSLDNLNTNNIKTYINEGAGFVDFSGHGSRTSWATHPPLGGKYEWIGTFTTSTASSLSNGNMLPVVILDACSCGKFDSGTCLAWALVKKNGGGAIASLAASALGYGIPGNPSAGVLGWMEYRFFTYYKQGKEIIGDTWTASLNGYLNSFGYNLGTGGYKTVEEWTLFGDPTLKMGGYGSEEPVVYLDKPVDGYLYINDRPIMKTWFGTTRIIGDITIEASAYNVERVEFYLDGQLKSTDTEAPYQWTFDERARGSHTIKVVGYGETQAEDEITVNIFHL